MNELELLGWSDFFSDPFAAHAARLYPARVASGGRGFYRIWTAHEEQRAELSPRLAEKPVAGDWVGVFHDGERAWIDHVLPRRTTLVRQSAGRQTRAQVVGANIDTVFVVTSLNSDFNVRRLERYLTMVWSSGAKPVIVLNKSDVCTEPAKYLAAAKAVAIDVPVFRVSAQTGQGLEQLNTYLSPGSTMGFVGTSGVGKSTLVNALAGSAVQKVEAIRERDERGQHTTTARELVRLDAGIVLDTPGMRELGVWGGADGLEVTFGEIAEAAAGCRFHDCTHESEPGCAVQASIGDGGIERERLASYRKLQREAERQERLHRAAGVAEERREARKLSKRIKAVVRSKRR